VPVQNITGRGQHSSSLRPKEKLLADFRLQSLHGLRQGRLRKMTSMSRQTEIASRGDGYKIPKLMKLHILSFLLQHKRRTRSQVADMKKALGVPDTTEAR
jgi:hypothetical protein